MNVTALHGLVLQTCDPEEAESRLSSTAIPYVSKLLPGSPAFSTQIFMTRGQRVHISRVVTRGLMRIESRLPEDSYALVLDLRDGIGMHRVGDRSFAIRRDVGLMQSPLQPVEAVTAPGFEALFVRIASSGMMAELERLLGQQSGKPLCFYPEVRLASAAGRKLRELCDDLRRTLYRTDCEDVTESSPLGNLESELITLLLQAQPHNYRRLLHRQSEAGNWQVNTAEEFMRANAHLPISLGDVCLAAAVNARTLQDSFRKKRNCTPMEFLREVRMEQVRDGLSNPTEDTSVSGEAAHWGFLHFGRFSNEYQKRFGELPSETLRRSRRR